MTGEMGRPKALVIAYSAEPGRGSEPGAGWALVETLAPAFDCVVIGGPEHTEGVEEWLDASGRPGGFEWVEVQEPFWGRLTKWHRVPWFVNYFMWLGRARKRARQLQREHSFDVAVHATFSTYWLPSPVVDLGVPSVWGPVGGGVTTPRPLRPVYHLHGLLDEWLDEFAVKMMSLLPSTRRTWQEATVRVVQNEETLARLPSELQVETELLNHTLLMQLPEPSQVEPEPYLVFPSALEWRKGVSVALCALAKTESLRLKIPNSGPLEKAARRQASQLGIEDRVDFLGRIPRDEYFDLVARSSGAIFTGLREEGGLSLAEAMAMGKRVIVLGVGGARTIAESALEPDLVSVVPVGPLREVEHGLARAMEKTAEAPRAVGGSNLPTESSREAFRTLVLGAAGCADHAGEKGQNGTRKGYSRRAS